MTIFVVCTVAFFVVMLNMDENKDFWEGVS